MKIGSDKPDQMTGPQKAVYDLISSGPRDGVPKPFLAMLDSPGIARAVQAVGAEIRYGSHSGDRLREIAILSAAAAYGSGYEWAYHNTLGAKAGLSETARRGLLSGTGEGLTAPEQAVMRYVFTAVRERHADQGMLAKIIETYGREVATEITAIAGYYPMLALFLSAGELDTPLPDREP